MKTKALIPTLVVALLLVGAATAQAKWSYGNGESDLEVGPSPAGAGFVCTTRIHGRAGLGTSADPAVTPPPPPPYSPRTVSVYTGSELGAAQVIGGELVLDGTTLTPIVTQVTAAPKALNPPEKYFGFSQDDPIWEYASAPFSFSFAPGQITAGNDVIVLQNGHSAFVIKSAIACPAQTSWRGETWNRTGNGNVAVAQTAKQLSFTLTSGGAVDPIGTYATDCTVAGDFDARVHYSLGPWPAHNGVRTAIVVNNPDYPFPPGNVTMERTSFAASGDVATGERYAINATDAGGGFLTVPTTQTQGDLRVRQKNGMIRTYYRDATTAGAWALVGKSAGYPGSVSFGLQVWSSLALFSGPTAKVTFSKFSFTKGVCA